MSILPLIPIMKKQLSKSQLKERQIKKDKFKQAFMKSFNIVCYIFSALFLVMCIALGIGSCNRSKKSNIDNIESSQILEVANKINDSFDEFYFTQEQLDVSYHFWNYAYEQIDSGDLELLDGQEFTFNPYAFQLYENHRKSLLTSGHYNSTAFRLVGIYFNFPVVARNDNGVISTSVFSVANYFNYNGDTYIEFDNKPLYDSNINLINDYVFNLSTSDFDRDDLTISLTFFRESDNAETYTEDLMITNILGGVKLQDKYFNLIVNDIDNYYFYNDIVWLVSRLLVVSTYNYSFNYNYNPGNIVFNANGTFYSTYTAIQLNTQYLVIDTGWFVADNQYFDSIKFNVVSLDSNTYVTYDGVNSVKYDGTDNFYILGVYFVNSIIGNSRTFMTISSIERTGGKSIYLGHYNVSNNLLYDLIFLQPYQFKNINQSNFLYVSDNFESAYSILNRQPFNTSNSGTSIIGGGNNNVFDLFKIGFNSIIPFLSVSILPSITIGVLLFMPLVVGIIVLIFKMVRK